MQEKKLETISEHATVLAEQATIRALLNSYLREVSVFDPRIIECPGIPDDQQAIRIRFPSIGEAIIGYIKRFSVMGQHEYGDLFFLEGEKCSPQQIGLERLIDLVLDEVAQHCGCSERSGEWNTMKKRILNSYCNMIDYVGYFLRSGIAPKLDYLGSEQTLYLGHPFHPFPKSREAQSDIPFGMKYCPEAQSSFRLHYFAIDADYISEAWIEGREQAVMPGDIDMTQVPGSRADAYRVLPLHPWQAKFLLADNRVKTFLESKVLVDLGEQGDHVTPTTSVRTVWHSASQCGFKLPLNVRITNLVRNNTIEESKRAIDAARIVYHLRNRLSSECFKILIETGFRTLDVSKLMPEQASVLASYFTVIWRPLEVDTSNTFVMASLLEEFPGENEPKLIQAIRQSYCGEIPDLRLWLSQYLNISMLPLLRLFTTTGISFEAHLQNTLLSIVNGMPSCFYVRDLEGVSVVRNHEVTSSLPDSLCISEQSPVWYDAQEAWHRTKYYFFVNHMGSLIHTLAQYLNIEEDELWGDVRSLLEQEKQYSDDTLSMYINDILCCESLPAKANLRSCFQARGEMPLFADIPNPLANNVQINAFSESQQPCDLTAALQSPCFAAVEQRILRQLIQALVFEGILPEDYVNVPPIGEKNKLITITARNGDSQVVKYQAHGRRTGSFDRVFLAQQAVIRVAPDGTCSQAELLQFLVEVLGAEQQDNDLQRFANELEQTLIKDVQAQALPRPAVLSARQRQYDELEGNIRDGHPYHPCYKSRIGFTLADNRRYGPEFKQPIKPVWIALAKTHSAMAHSSSIDYQEFLKEELGAHGYQAYNAVLEKKGVSIDNYWLMPVHPWQWQEKIKPCFYRQLRDEQIILLGDAPDDYYSQQSIRTLANYSDKRKSSLKMALGITNTSTSRILAAHTTLNGPVITDWLKKLVNRDRYSRNLGVVMLGEVLGIAYHGDAEPLSGYGMLGAIWRESLHKYLCHDEAAVPFNALCHVEVNGVPFIDPWVKSQGIEVWTEQLLKVVITPIIHLLYAEGVALESHGQNIILIHHQGRPVRIALKDFHDGVRFSEAYLAHPEFSPHLVPEADRHARFNSQSFIKTDQPELVRDFVYDAFVFICLTELCLFLNEHYSMSESCFWEMTAQVILDYQVAHPEHQARFDLFDLFAKHIAIEKLTSRRLVPGADECFKTVDNPLHGFRPK